jgi:GGDEF domain-containing protein
VTSLTASFGLCALDRLPAECAGVAARMVGAADTALYQSKRRGRNRVTLAHLAESSRAAPQIVNAS